MSKYRYGHQTSLKKQNLYQRVWNEEVLEKPNRTNFSWENGHTEDYY